MLGALLHIPTEVVINTFTVAVDQGQQFAPLTQCQSKVSNFVRKEPDSYTSPYVIQLYTGIP